MRLRRNVKWRKRLAYVDESRMKTYICAGKHVRGRARNDQLENPNSDLSPATKAIVYYA